MGRTLEECTFSRLFLPGKGSSSQCIYRACLAGLSTAVSSLLKRRKARRRHVSEPLLDTGSASLPTWKTNLEAAQLSSRVGRSAFPKKARNNVETTRFEKVDRTPACSCCTCMGTWQQLKSMHAPEPGQYFVTSNQTAK